MAVRRPLVLVSGQPQELPQGDSVAGVGGGWATIIKGAAESRATNATLTADSELKVTLGVGQWAILVRARLLTGNATMDYKYDVNFTGTATYRWRLHRHTTAGAATGTDNETVTVSTGVVPSTSVAATTSGAASVEIDLIIDVTVAGEFQFRWAQDTSNGSNLTCLEGSYLEYASA